MPAPPPLQSLSPFPRILFSVLLIIVCSLSLFLAGLLLALPLFGWGVGEVMDLLSDYTNPEATGILKYFQAIQELGIFIIPPVLAAYLFSGKPLRYLGLHDFSSWKAWLLTVILMVVSVPCVDLTIRWNESMALPEWLSGVETWMKETESQAFQLTETFLDVHTAEGFLFNFLLIALLPAIGEELLFRGLLQRLFREWFGNIHVAILVTGFLFGAMHLQFYGILPRTLLGILFGYLFYWSGSLWIPILAHFVNNAAAVTISFLEKQGWISDGLTGTENPHRFFLVLSSLVFTALLLWVFRYHTRMRIREGD